MVVGVYPNIQLVQCKSMYDGSPQQSLSRGGLLLSAVTAKKRAVATRDFDWGFRQVQKEGFAPIGDGPARVKFTAVRFLPSSASREVLACLKMSGRVANAD